MFVALSSGVLLLLVDRGSAEFVLMVGMFGCSSVFLALVAVLARFLQKH
jgi:hypothetical protein